MEDKALVRESILCGVLTLPTKLYNIDCTDADIDVMDRFFESLWRNYLKNRGTTSLPYWSQQFSSEKVFNVLLVSLAKDKWIISTVIPSRNWGEVQLNELKLLDYVTPDELMGVRVTKKYNTYILRNTKSTISNLTKQGRTYADTGLVREGFAKAGNTRFSYDATYIEKYLTAIQLNLTKSMDKIAQKYPDMYRDEADYAAISLAILTHHMEHPEEVFTCGNNFNDSRGRAISSVLRKIFNPISSKDARALLLIDPKHREPITYRGLCATYLFIGELLGFKKGNKTAKMQFGMSAYKQRQVPTIDMNSEKSRKDLHELIWLERIYDELDKHNADKAHKWSVPTELDASASMLQYEALLTNHAPFARMTNLIETEVLNDPWEFPNIPRKQFKVGMTPKLYGSTKTEVELWEQYKRKEPDFTYTASQVQAFRQELSSGVLAVADRFSRFIINNCKPKEVMTVVVGDDTFTIKCNRFRNKGDRHITFKLYDSRNNELRTIIHTETVKVPDLQQFRRYFVTLLIHCLDSQVADAVCIPLSWVIPIHDAFIVHPNYAHVVRSTYAFKMTQIYNNRETILANYFQSIGIGPEAQAEWNQLKRHIEPINIEDFEVYEMCLK